MAKDNVKKIKKYIDDILGTKSSLKNKLPSKQNYNRNLFCEVLRNLQFVNSRTLGMKHDYKVNMIEYDDPFYVTIENLIKLQFTQEQQQLQEGLRYYQRARSYYAAGMERFKDTIVTGFVKNANAAPGRQLDIKGVLDHVVKPGQPEKLANFLKAIKGIRPGKRQPFTPEAQTVRFAEEDLTISQAKAKLADLTQTGVDTTVLKQGIRQAEEAVANRMAFGIASGTGGETVRKQLAGEYISRLLDDTDLINLKNGAPFIDGIKLARAVNKLGSTKNILFKNEIKELEELTRILRSTGAEIDREVFKQFEGRPLVEAIKGVKEAVKNQKDVGKDAFV